MVGFISKDDDLFSNGFTSPAPPLEGGVRGGEK